MTLLRRILAEKRSVVVPLVLAFVANVVTYVLVAYPLSLKSAGAAERAAVAASAREAMERELATAQALVTGKAQADDELAAFYLGVLPSDLAAARRMTYASLPELARRTGVSYVRRSFEVEAVESESRLGRLSIRVVLQGGYDDIREFLYELESALEFVIIDEVTLTEASVGESITLTLSLSTYYRTEGNGV